MYGASLTKFVFAYMVDAARGRGDVDLDQSIAGLSAQAVARLPALRGAQVATTAGVSSRRASCSAHSSGLANFAFLEPDEKMRIHFEPGSRYAYSGEGINLLQFVLETGLGLRAGDEMQRRVFARFGMTRTSMKWRDDFAGNLADGYKSDGSYEPHDQAQPTARGGVDGHDHHATCAKFLAGFSRGDGLSARSRAEMIKPQIAIQTPSQFPTLLEAISPAMNAINLSAGLGVITFDGPFGHAFFKGGHDDSTGNQAICVDKSRRCIAFLSNDVRAERLYQRLTEATLEIQGCRGHGKAIRRTTSPPQPNNEQGVTACVYRADFASRGEGLAACSRERAARWARSPAA